MTTNRKRHLKSEFALFQTSSILFYSIFEFEFVTSWRNCLGLNSKGPYLSGEKEKENFCSLFTNNIRRVREIRKFQVAGLQRRLRNVQKSVKHVQSCCFVNKLQYKPIVFLPFSFAALAVAFAKAPYCCDLKMLLPW